MKAVRVKSVFAFALFLIVGGLMMCAVASTDDFDKYRKILVSPTINTPQYFAGFGGFCGWPEICRLHNGDLFVTFGAGYWHASWVTPFDIHPRTRERYKEQFPWLMDWEAPTGGHVMWIRSTDNGETWTQPKAFPVVPGAYALSDVKQLSDGTMLAGAKIEIHHYRSGMPTTPVEFAQWAATHIPMKMVVYRSNDSGETWYEVSRPHGPFMFLSSQHAFLEAPDGAVLLLISGVPYPGGGDWPQSEERFVSAMMRSEDKGGTWEVISVVGSNDFNVEECTPSYLPDGSIGFASRKTSAWFQSYDDGRTWSEPRKLLEGSGKIFKKGDLQVTPDGTAVLVFCGGPGGSGQVMYSRDSGKTWVKPAPDRGFKFDPIAYYPDACVLEDGSIFAVGDHQGFECEYGPYGAETTAMRFRIKSAEEGEGIELLPIGE